MAIPLRDYLLKKADLDAQYQKNADELNSVRPADFNVEGQTGTFTDDGQIVIKFASSSFEAVKQLQEWLSGLLA